MPEARFEWDSNKDKVNQKKHHVSFSLAQYAFLDSNRVIARDLRHSVRKNVIFASDELVMAL